MHECGASDTAGITRARIRGFTLIELMVVIVIVSILMALAIPGYSLYIKKSRRADAEATLMDIAQREQQYLNDSRAYAATTATLGTTVPVDVSTYYTITIAAPAVAPPTFTVTATPLATSSQASDYTLTLDQAGNRGPANAW
jgi:type IV pilus assembly protein PilE